MTASQTATIVKDYATAAAIVVAGLWALWRWIHAEMLRRGREMASPDGTLTASWVELSADSIIVTLNAVWRNRGPLPIELCPEHSKVSVYALKTDNHVGVLNIHENTSSDLVVDIPPWWSTYVFEPNTESLMQEHVVLGRGRVYAFRWRICLKPGALPGRHKRKHLFNRRDLIWKAP